MLCYYRAQSHLLKWANLCWMTQQKAQFIYDPEVRRYLRCTQEDQQLGEERCVSSTKKIKPIRLYRSRERTGLDNTRVNQTVEALQGYTCLSRLMCTVKASRPSIPCFILKDIVLLCMYGLDIFFGFLSCLFLWNLNFHLLSSFV